MPVDITLLPLEEAEPIKFSLYMVGENGSFPVLEFLEKLEQSNKKSYERLMAILGHVSKYGPITNDKRKCRALHDNPKIYEFKTPDQNRIAWFYDKGRVIICATGFQKPKKKELKQEIDKALVWHSRYFQAQANKQLNTLNNE